MSVTALTTLDFIERTKARILPPNTPLSLSNQADFPIEMCIPGALEALAEAVAASGQRRMLMKDFPSTAATAGLLDLSVAAFAGMLVHTLPLYGQVRLNSGTTPILWSPPRRNAALATSQLDVIHCWLEGRNLRFKNTDGSISTFVAATVVNASFIPTVATLPQELEGMLVSTLTTLVSERGGLEFLPPDKEEMGGRIARAL